MSASSQGSTSLSSVTGEGGGTSETTSLTGSSDPENSTTATSAEQTGSPGPLFDVNLVLDAPAIDRACGKIDVLFAIDNSGSMLLQQNRLLASFPGFIAALQNALAFSANSYHVGVVTSDAYAFNAKSCNALGDLVSQTGGANSSAQDCSPAFSKGRRFATEDDDLEAAFSCIAQVGTNGSGIELPASAAVSALSPESNGAGGCNEGFLRDDAILVLVVITDDTPFGMPPDDAGPLGNPNSWYDEIVAAKNDNPEAVVVIGLVPWMDVSCAGGEVESPNLIEFVELFGDQGVLGSICLPDFSPLFADTISTIVSTCENFDPQG